MSAHFRTDVVQLGQEVTFILQETHKRFLSLNPTECLYVSSFIIHQLPEQTDLLSQQRLSLTASRVAQSSSNRFDIAGSRASLNQPSRVTVQSSCNGHSSSYAGLNPRQSTGSDADDVRRDDTVEPASAAAGTPTEDTLASTATASSLGTADENDDIDPFDHDGGEFNGLQGGYYDDQVAPQDEGNDTGLASARGMLSPYELRSSGNNAAPLNLNLAKIHRRGVSADNGSSDLITPRPSSMNLWQQSVVAVLQDAARTFRRYEEEAEEAEDDVAGWGGAATHTTTHEVRPSLQRALEEAADRWCRGSGSQWQTPRAGVASAAAAMSADTPRPARASAAVPPLSERPPAAAAAGDEDEAATEMLMAMRAVEQQARSACRRAYEDIYDRCMEEARQAETPQDTTVTGRGDEPAVLAVEPPTCSIVIECDAPENGATSASNSPLKALDALSSSPCTRDTNVTTTTEAPMLAFVVGCSFAQLDYLQRTVLACACDPYPGTNLTDIEYDAMDPPARRALLEKQRVWRQRHCLIRILEPSNSLDASEATSITDGGEKDTLSSTGAPYALSEGFFALRSLLGLAFDVLSDMDPHLVAIIDDPERSQEPTHVVSSTVFWAAWPQSVPLRPRRGEQRASLRGGPPMPLPLLPADVITSFGSFE